MDNQQFENLINQAVAALPDNIRKKLDNVDIVMEEGGVTEQFFVRFVSWRVAIKSRLFLRHWADFARQDYHLERDD